jgi:hypothetical protein
MLYRTPGWQIASKIGEIQSETTLAMQKAYEADVTVNNYIESMSVCNIYLFRQQALGAKTIIAYLSHTTAAGRPGKLSSHDKQIA